MFVDFSVVVRTFRRPRELIEAVSSVLRQVGATIEVFVIDDSPEGSAEEAVGQSATNVSPI
jgi:glycosyltransferase involved in cell wall biosynthesis